MVTWWTNIRFEKSFTQDLCILLASSGCIAVSGGLEVAYDRLLEVIKKGVTVSQVAQVTNNFTNAEIMVHAYLMYGYPTQTIQETIDSLEMVRQLFEEGVIQSGFWHQFALTTHSPIGADPESYGLHTHKVTITFADNDIAFTDKTGINHGIFSQGLKTALYNYMLGVGFELPLQEWFDFEIPKTTIPLNFVVKSLQNNEINQPKLNHRLIYLGPQPKIITYEEDNELYSDIIIQELADEISFTTEEDLACWFCEMMNNCHISSDKTITYGEFVSSCTAIYENFEEFWHSEPVEHLKQRLLLVV